jgi:hypothetical protein
MSDLRSLIEAAKADAPNAAARAKVWAGVSSVVGEGAALAGSGALTGSASATKLLILGTLLGGSLTVGIGAALLFVRTAAPTTGMGIAAPAPPFVLAEVAPPVPALAGADALRIGMEPAPVEIPIANDTTLVSAGSLGGHLPARVASISAPVPAPAPAPDSARRSPSAPRALALAAAAPGTGAVQNTASVPATADDALAREASLLAEARNALAKRDALSALQIIRGLRALPTRQLVPEELSVEAQALRSLGLDDDANAVDGTLRTRFPDSVLGR